MLSIITFVISLAALLTQFVTSLPSLPLSSDDAGLTVDLNPDLNRLFTGTETELSQYDSGLDPPPSAADSESLVGVNQLALNVDGSASALPVSQDKCDKSLPKGKRGETGGKTSCPAEFRDTVRPGSASPGTPKKVPEGQQPVAAPQTPINERPEKPYNGDVRFGSPVESPSQQTDDSSICPKRYKYTVCGTEDGSVDAWRSHLTLIDADLVLNFGIGRGSVVRPDWANRGGWTDTLEECGPPRKIYCCGTYFDQARQALDCEPLEMAQKVEQCWEGVRGFPTQTVWTCLDNIGN